MAGSFFHGTSISDEILLARWISVWFRWRVVDVNATLCWFLEEGMGRVRKSLDPTTRLSQPEWNGNDIQQICAVN